MLAKDWKKDLFTIPNVLSLFRLVLIPVYVVLYLKAEKPEDYFLAAAILAVSCLTDLIDGKIARHFHMISNTGKILDPLADKATQFTLIVCLTIQLQYPVLLFLAVLFVVKEAFQAIAGFLILRKGQILKGALIAGKISTAVLFISLIILVLIPNISKTAVYIIAGADILFLLISFVSYIRLYYTHSPKESHEAFISEIFRTNIPKPAAEQKKSFAALLNRALEDECDLDVVQTIHDQLCQRIAIHKESRVPDTLLVSKSEVKEILDTCGVAENRLAKFSIDYDEAFGFEADLYPKNNIDNRRLDIHAPDVSIQVSPERSDLIETRVIDGVKYILIQADGDVEVNGVSIHIAEKDTALV